MNSKKQLQGKALMTSKNKFLASNSFLHKFTCEMCAKFKLLLITCLNKVHFTKYELYLLSKGAWINLKIEKL